MIPEVRDGPGAVTVISGLTFAVSDERGDIAAGEQGLFSRDTRHLSRLQLLCDGQPMRALGAGVLAADAASFHGATQMPGSEIPDPPVEVARARVVRDGTLTDTILVRCWGDRQVRLRVELAIEADFTDVFAVRNTHSGLAGTAGEAMIAATHLGSGRLRLQPMQGDLRTDVRLDPEPDDHAAGVAGWDVTVGAGHPWTLIVRVVAADGAADPSGAPAPRSHEPRPVVRSVPEDLARACAMGLDDLDALTVPDPLEPSRRLTAAGIPWYVALFGRDSLITAHQVRALDPPRMLDTLAGLAARQGTVTDPGNEEDPGKILHELRFTPNPWLGTGTTSGNRAYYGTVDATPLFVMLLAEAWRWGAAREVVQRLLPAARAAVDWLRGPADPDGDGFVEHQASGPGSLVNQAWKDSPVAAQSRDGSLAHGPVAWLEVQGYACRARRDLSEMLEWLGHREESAALRAEADRLAGAIRERFWLPGDGTGPGYFAMALDGDKRPVDAVSSNMGHLLWCGVPTGEQAGQVGEHLRSPAMDSGWGLRTIAGDMAGYNPISYHLGSVWPHDTAIACEGLRRYGLDAAAMQLAMGLLDVLPLFHHRMPELYGGHQRTGTGFPVPYPSACRPQAWSAGTPAALLTMLLGLEVHVPRGRVSLRPVLPRGMERLEVRGLPVGAGHLSVLVDENGTQLLQTLHGMEVDLQ